MRLPLLDRLERLHAEWPEGSFARRHAQSAAFPALVAALRLAVEALDAATHEINDANCQDWPPGHGCDGCRGDSARADALAKIEALLATEEATT